VTVLPVESATERKARGAFYTPPPIAHFLAEWAITEATRRVLEPSAGDGVFLEAAATRFRELGGSRELVGVELVAQEAAFAQGAAIEAGWHPRMIVSDFFDVNPNDVGEVDAVIGNPPWIRYHGFTGDQREKGRVRAAAMGIALSGLASSWAPFVVHACAFLSSTGRLAMVVPAELLHAEYAEPVRKLLTERFASVRLVAFDHHVFEGTQVDALLLLASQDGPAGLHFDRVRSFNELSTHRPSLRRATVRWGNAMVDDEAGAILAELEASGRFVRLGTLGAVDIGIVTGFNDYFVVSEREVEGFQLPRDILLPILTRSDQLATGTVSQALFDRWTAAGRRVWLLALPRVAQATPRAYLQEGIRMNVPDRYKCRVRDPWWSVPLRPAPNLFLSYMAHRAPRIAVNELGARSTNLIHGVYLEDPSVATAIATVWSNPVTELSCELEGRTYGGGVLKLETKEAERVLVQHPTRQQLLTTSETVVLARATEARRAARLRRPKQSSITSPLGSLQATGAPSW
jgi:adenine-specific DNA-methyltransferase